MMFIILSQNYDDLNDDLCDTFPNIFFFNAEEQNITNNIMIILILANIT